MQTLSKYAIESVYRQHIILPGVHSLGYRLCSLNVGIRTRLGGDGAGWVHAHGLRLLLQAPSSCSNGIHVSTVHYSASSLIRRSVCEPLTWSLLLLHLRCGLFDVICWQILECSLQVLPRVIIIIHRLVRIQTIRSQTQEIDKLPSCGTHTMLMRR